ncbi:hypothetical protein JB92DRAFT_2829510 [Gautieria morchelliformis]|nr:hypothetical protein JB92DRAFT_2829510 [Gautieria morchelliformis]
MADAAMAPVPVVLVLSPEAVRCSTRRDTAVLLAKLHLSAESARFWKCILVTPGLRRTASGDQSYNWRMERRKQPKRQSIEASSAKLRLATERKVAKIGRKKRKKNRQDSGCAGAGGRGPTHRQEDWRNGSNGMQRRVGQTMLRMVKMTKEQKQGRVGHIHNGRSSSAPPSALT